MLLDISGNTFSSFGNTVPTVIYTPPQILGTGMTIWYDFNDTSTLYTDSAATTNVQNTGDYILYVKNKATGRPLYDLRKSNPSNLPISAYTSGTASVLVFNKGALNTNKNSNYLLSPAATNSQATPINSISGYSTTGKSAFTWSAVYRVLTSNTAQISTSFQSNLFPVTFSNNNNTSISVSNFGSTTVTFPIGITTVNGYYFCTITVNENKNAIIYLNNFKTTINASGITYPLLSTTSVFHPFWRQGGVFSVRSSRETGLVEFCFNDSEVLTDDQVAKLHQYYKVKYNLL